MRSSGTLQVATPEILDPASVDLRPLESLASHAARALESLKQVEEIRRLNRSLEGQAAELVKSEAALREQTRILQSVLDCMGEGVVVADREARLLVFNPAAERILGRSSGLTASDRWNPLYQVYRPDRATPYSAEDLPLYRAIRGESIDHVEVYVAHPSLQDGSWMLINARPLRDEQGETQGGLVVFHDITRRKNYERRLAVQYAATKVLAEVDSLERGRSPDPRDHRPAAGLGLRRLLASRPGDPPVAVRHALARGRHVLPSVRAGDPQDHVRHRGSACPGRVWESREAVWIPEISRDPNFPRWQAAAEDGLLSGFAVPILVRGECLGVFEFFSRERRPPDAELLEMMTNLGRQIGQFIERHQMHARVVQSEKLASLGMLSAGVAHEINNPLAYIANNLAVLERDIGSLLALVSTYEQAHDLLASHCPEVLGRDRSAERRMRLPLHQGEPGQDPREHAAGRQARGRDRPQPPRLRPARPGRRRPGRHP